MIKCALIGYGYWGPNIAKSIFRIPQARLNTLVDLDQSKLDQAAQLYPSIIINKDLDQVLKDPNIDAVLIATPPKTHFALISKALKANKHVFVEKPLTMTVRDAIEIKKINKKYKKIVMVGHTFEYNPSILKIKKLIEDNELGKIYYIYSSRVNLGQVRYDIDALWNLAPHDISICNMLFNALPVEVSAYGGTYLQSKISDLVFILARYPKNILAHIHLSWLDPTKERKMTIVGSNKMVVFDDIDNEMPVKIFDKKVVTGDIATGLPGEYKMKLHSGDIYIPQIDSKEPLLEELRHFIECINNNKATRTDIDNGLRVVKVLAACQKSIENNGKWIKI